METTRACIWCEREFQADEPGARGKFCSERCAGKHFLEAVLGIESPPLGNGPWNLEPDFRFENLWRGKGGNPDFSPLENREVYSGF